MLNKQRLLAILVLVVVFLSGCNLQFVKVPLSVRPTLLTIIPNSKQENISVPSSFIGMNIELIDICSVLRIDAAHRGSFEQLFKNFGTGTLHIGGHSSDEGIWAPDSRYACLSHPIVTKKLVQVVFAFARRIHWNVIWGLNFLINDPRMDAAEANYVASIGGSTLLGFSIGNEPEIFAKHKERPAGWGYSNYLAEWRADSNAVLEQVPSARFFGPEACCQTPWFSSFTENVGSTGILIAASRHYYYYSGAHANAVNLTPQTLLSPQAMQQFILAARGWVAAADNQSLPVDITEINSISNGGISGISNTFGAALWTSDILFESAQLGINALDFQEVPDASYAFINEQATPQVIYYGLLFFYLVANHSQILQSALNTSENVSAYVFKGADGTLRVVIINKEPKKEITISMQPGKLFQKVATLRMQGTSLNATSGIALGDTTLSANGIWKMPMQVNEPVQGGQITLNIPASSAALFTFSA